MERGPPIAAPHAGTRAADVGAAETADSRTPPRVRNGVPHAGTRAADVGVDGNRTQGRVRLGNGYD